LPAGRRGPLASRGPYASILPVYQQRDWGPGMVKCVGPIRCSLINFLPPIGDTKMVKIVNMHFFENDDKKC